VPNDLSFRCAAPVVRELFNITSTFWINVARKLQVSGCRWNTLNNNERICQCDLCTID
jgi:hypothetical protein